MACNNDSQKYLLKLPMILRYYYYLAILMWLRDEEVLYNQMGAIVVKYALLRFT